MAGPGVWRWHLNDRRERPRRLSGKTLGSFFQAGADDDDKDEHDTQRGRDATPSHATLWHPPAPTNRSVADCIPNCSSLQSVGWLVGSRGFVSPGCTPGWHNDARWCWLRQMCHNGYQANGMEDKPMSNECSSVTLLGGDEYLNRSDELLFNATHYPDLIVYISRRVEGTIFQQPSI